VLAFDILTKMVVQALLPLNGGPREVLGELLRWNHIRNAGAAFGLLQGGRVFFVIVSCLSVVVILYLVLARRVRTRASLIGFGMILGGALGNLLDRLWLGMVTDFIDIGLGLYRWPVFNVADMGVTLGVLVLVVGWFREDRRRAEGRRGAEDSQLEGNQPAEAEHA
jgi:signal peptidase II